MPDTLMPKAQQTLRRGIAGALSVATLGVSLALPLLDAREPGKTDSVEAAHEPGRCAFGHDHKACLQFASSQADGSPATRLPAPDLEQAISRIGRRDTPAEHTHHDPSLPRAPPLIG